jgi:hypothetical protein
LYKLFDFIRSVLDSDSDAEDQHNSTDRDDGASTSNGTTLKTDTGSVESVPAVTSNDGSASPTGGSTNAALTTGNPEVLTYTEIDNSEMSLFLNSINSRKSDTDSENHSARVSTTKVNAERTLPVLATDKSTLTVPPTGESTNAALTKDKTAVFSYTEIDNDSESSSTPGISLTSTTPLNCIYFSIS